MSAATHYHEASKKGRFVPGLPSFGYVYFLHNADDAERDPPAVAGTHVKIGASDVFGRRMKSILIPVDWDKSVVVRMPDWDHAYKAEKRLHRFGPIARLQDRAFLKLSKYNAAHRYREGMAGQNEWFHMEAFDIAIKYLEKPDMRAAFKWSRIVPASEVVPGPERPETAYTATAYRQAHDILDKFRDMLPAKIVANCPNPASDDYHVFIVAPKHAMADAWLAHGQQLRLPFVDGVTIPMLGPTVDLPAIGMQGAEMVFTRANNVERGREMDSMVNLILAGLAAPSLANLPKGVTGAIHQHLGRKDMIVNGHLFMNERTNRWRKPEPEQPLLLDGDDVLSLAPPAAEGRGARPVPRQKAAAAPAPGLFDDPA